MPTKTSIEKYLEHKFVAWCKANGVLAVKGDANMYKGIPDRIVILPKGGGTIWVEFKGDSYYQLTPMQLKWQEWLMASDSTRYFVINDKEELQRLIDYCLMLML